MKKENKLYNDPDAFFALDGNATMRLSTTAATQLCQIATEKGKVVVIVEGGVWQNPGFMSRVDCIWHGIDPPMSAAKANECNLDAMEFIEQSSDAQDTFILTVASFHT